MFSNLFSFVFFALIAVNMGEKAELQILQANGAFTNKLYKELTTDGKNFVFSPISAHEVLSMSYLGAVGSTAQAYVTALNLPDPTITAEGYSQITTNLNNVPNVTLLIANKVYVKQESKLKKEFESAVVSKFHSEVQSVSFENGKEAAKIINTWVEEKTKNKIKELIDSASLNNSTSLVLINAIYFKGDWKHKFDKENTRTEPFYVNENETIDVQMMHSNQRKFNFKFDEQLNAKIIELPYTNTDVSLIVVLPNDKDGINDLEKKLETADLTKLTEEMRLVEVILALPKFKIESTLDLKEPLEKLGLAEIFADKANFSNMIEGGEPLKVSKVVQKAFIEVNEDGSEAAAATEIFIVPLSAVQNQFFLADHPFTVLLKYKSVILFNAKTVRPISGDDSVAPRGNPVKDPLSHSIIINLED